MGRSKTRSRRQRRARLKLAPPMSYSAMTSPAAMVARALALPAIDHLLDWLLARPRVLQVMGLLVGICLVGLALRPLRSFAGAVAPAAVEARAAQVAPTGAMPAVPSGLTEEAAIDLVANYNQASITAAVLGRADVMAPYLAPDGSAWADVRAEYQRRATRGETHAPALTRWGVLRVAVNSDTATVETQEQWDDQTSVGGQIIRSRRGILTQNVYELRRVLAPQRWLITAITTTNIID